MANIQKQTFEIEDKNITFALVKLDQMIKTTNTLVATLAGDDDLESNKIDNLIGKSAEYSLNRDAFIGKIKEEIIPQVVPADLLSIKSNVILNYEKSEITVEYDQDELDAYIKSKSGNNRNGDEPVSSGNDAEPVEAVEGEVVE